MCWGSQVYGNALPNTGETQHMRMHSHILGYIARKAIAEFDFVVVDVGSVVGIWDVDVWG